ncbi:MAG TPA: hypothetical protein VFU71_02275 [Burkholderiaceae bacterium]|nr:hypothetical protein [Burkholderiaceae bacterium]
MVAALRPGAARRTAERRPAWWRAPFLLLAFVALAAGVLAGLARLGVAVPTAAAGLAALHGPLMVGGFFGVVIALERAVAIGRAWAYAAPLFAAMGSVLLLLGAASPARWLYVAGSAVLLIASLNVSRRQREWFTVTIALGAACWTAGVAAWAAGAPVHAVAPWWLSFLVLTIAGERLELSRLLPPSARARQVFAALLGLAVLALFAASRWPSALRVYGLALLGLALWLLKQDVARRTVRQHGLARFIAVCLLSGYVWLAVAGVVVAAAREWLPGTPAYDAALHAVLLGFVFAMVFGHAPVIFPAVLRVAVPYHPVFYAPLVVLHASLLLRVAGDAMAYPALLRAGGLLAAVALALFVLVTVGAVIRGRRAPRDRAA